MKREYKFHILHKMQKVELGIMIYIRKRPRSHAYLVYLLTTKGKTLYIYMYITYIYMYDSIIYCSYTMTYSAFYAYC